MPATHQIGRADEVRDERVARMIVDVAGRADLRDPRRRASPRCGPTLASGFFEVVVT